MRTKGGGGGLKIPKILRASFMYGPIMTSGDGWVQENTTEIVDKDLYGRHMCTSASITNNGLTPHVNSCSPWDSCNPRSLFAERDELRLLRGAGRVPEEDGGPGAHLAAAEGGQGQPGRGGRQQGPGRQGQGQ